MSETLEHLVTLATAVGFTDEAISIFLARGLTWTTRRADGVEEESMTVEKIPLADVGGMIADGEITDAKTVAGLLLAQQKLALRSDG